MLFPNWQYPMVRSFRSMLPRLLVLTGAAALAGCGSTESPLDPATETAPIETATDAVAAADGLAALTTARIAFTSYSGMLGDIYLMDAQGNNRTRLTTWASTEFAPSLSYDRKRIAMVRYRTDAANAQHCDIYLMNADGTSKHWAKSYTSAFDIMNPSWSPDGSRLVLTVFLQNLPYVATLNLATGQLALVWATGGAYMQGEDPSYDPTGQKIVYVGASHSTVDLVVPGGPHLVPVSSGTRVGAPTFSPDGKKIAYSQIATGSFNNYEIFVRTLATGVVTRLTNNGKVDGEPSWSPDGTRIAFSSDRSGRPQIWTMNSSTGGGLVRITNSSRDDVEPAWYH
jgi:Periplasmic component of the Tol biopolymer transport system